MAAFLSVFELYRFECGPGVFATPHPPCAMQTPSTITLRATHAADFLSKCRPVWVATLRCALVDLLPNPLECVQSNWVNCLQRLATHICVHVQVRVARHVHRQRIRTDPPIQIRRQIPLAEVREADVDVLFLPGVCCPHSRRRLRRLRGLPQTCARACRARVTEELRRYFNLRQALRAGGGDALRPSRFVSVQNRVAVGGAGWGWFRAVGSCRSQTRRARRCGGAARRSTSDARRPSRRGGWASPGRATSGHARQCI